MGLPPALHEPDSHNFADSGSSDRLRRREAVAFVTPKLLSPQPPMRPTKGELLEYDFTVTLDYRGAMPRPERISG
jgi:hypothetical protein